MQFGPELRERRSGPIITLMRRRDLLTQVLAANLLLIVAAVVGRRDRGEPDIHLTRPSRSGARAGLAIAFTVVLNLSLLQRRFGPLERLVDEMERADLTRPGANLRQPPTRVGRRRSRACTARSPACSSASRPSAGGRRAPRSQAQEQERARVARDLHDEVNQALTGLLLRLEAAREGAARARRRARRDQGARQPGDAGAAHTRPRSFARRRSTTSGSRPRSPATCARSPPGPVAGDLRGPSASSGASRPTRSSSSTGSPRRRSERRSPLGAEHVRVSSPAPRRATRVELRVADDGRGFTFDEASRARDRRHARARAPRRRGLSRSSPGRSRAQGFGWRSCR